MAYMQKDLDGNPIPALGLRDDAAHQITSSGTSARNSTAFNAATRIIFIYATENIYIKFGDDTVTATTSDHFLPAGTMFNLTIRGGKSGAQYSHVAVLQVSSGGTVYISETE